MRNIILPVLCCCGLIASCFGQIGLGLGSQGLLFKTAPDSRYSFTARAGFQLGAQTVFRPQISFTGRMVNEVKAKLYAGVGAGFSLLAEDDPNTFAQDTYQYFLLYAPLGFEFFPFQSKLFSVTVETGLDFFISDNRVGNQGYLKQRGLVELTFYFSKKP